MWKVFFIFLFYPTISAALSISNISGLGEEVSNVTVRFENNLSSNCWSNKEEVKKYIVDKFQLLGVGVVFTGEEFQNILFVETLGQRLEERCYATIVLTLIKFHSLTGEPTEIAELIKKMTQTSIQRININQFLIETVDQFFSDF